MSTKIGKKRITFFIIGGLICLTGYFLYQSDDTRMFSYLLFVAAVVVGSLGRSKNSETDLGSVYLTPESVQ